jgi:hypothetical protein
MDKKCNAELCINWTGSGCICDVMGLDKEEARLSEPEEETAVAPTCDRCDDPARFGVQPEDVDTLHACARHLADVAIAAIEAWGEHGVICIYSATED